MNITGTHRAGTQSMLIPIVGLSLLCSGCTSLTEKKEGTSVWQKLPWVGEKEEEPYPNPRKMAVTWTPDVIMRTGSTPTRGFGGRVFFYDEKTRPVPVEGELAIQAFVQGADGKPKKLQRYGFTAEQFTRHYSQSDLGGSYSIWIPWDAVGGDEEKVTLVPSFRTEQGSRVHGAASVVLLPGKSNRFTEPNFNPLNGEMYAQGTPIRPGAWTSANASPELFRRSGLTTTTIPVRQQRQRGNSMISTTTNIVRNGKIEASRLGESSVQPAGGTTRHYGVQPASATSIVPPGNTP